MFYLRNKNYCRVVLTAPLTVAVGKEATDAIRAAEDLEEETSGLGTEADIVKQKIASELRPALLKLSTEGEESVDAAQNMSESLPLNF